MLTMGIDIGSRSAQCVILEDGQLLTYGNIETGPESAKTAYAAATILWRRFKEKLFSVWSLPDGAAGSVRRRSPPSDRYVSTGRPYPDR